MVIFTHKEFNLNTTLLREGEKIMTCGEHPQNYDSSWKMRDSRPLYRLKGEKMQKDQQRGNSTRNQKSHVLKHI